MWREWTHETAPRHRQESEFDPLSVQADAALTVPPSSEQNIGALWLRHNRGLLQPEPFSSANRQPQDSDHLPAVGGGRSIHPPTRHSLVRSGREVTMPFE